MMNKDGKGFVVSDRSLSEWHQGRRSVANVLRQRCFDMVIRQGCAMARRTHGDSSSGEKDVFLVLLLEKEEEAIKLL